MVEDRSAPRLQECGTAGFVNIVPNWHDRVGAAAPFTEHWQRSDLPLKLIADMGSPPSAISQDD